MLYKYVFFPGVNYYIYIVISSLISCDFILKWGYYTSHYNICTPHLHQAIRVVKTSKLLQVKSISWSRFLMGGCPLTPYPDSQGVMVVFMTKQPAPPPL